MKHLYLILTWVIALLLLSLSFHLLINTDWIINKDKYYNTLFLLSNTVSIFLIPTLAIIASVNIQKHK